MKDSCSSKSPLNHFFLVKCAEGLVTETTDLMRRTGLGVIYSSMCLYPIITGVLARLRW
jgi:hypothetical protein